MYILVRETILSLLAPKNEYLQLKNVCLIVLID